MTSRTSRTANALLVLLAVCPQLYAQRAQTPTLNQILEHLQANLNHYDATVPSFFCEEHVVSSRVQSGERDENTITDSIFRLKRTPRADHTSTLVESREIKSVNGEPPASQRIEGPSLLSGAFEGGLAVVSMNQTSCMNYDLQRINSRRPTDPLVVRFANVLTPQNTADCLLQEKSKGRALIDPASMQITHLELDTPRHAITPGNAFSSRIVGDRSLTVDYAPVLLGGETFWMPSAISMRTTSGSGTFHMIAWTFHATYRDYHKLEVTSRILPPAETPAP